MNLEPVPLASLAAVHSGGGAPQEPTAFGTSGIPFVRAGSLSKLLDGVGEDSLEKIEPEVADQHRLKVFPAGTVLFAKSGMSATKGHVYRLRGPAYVVNHLAALVPHDSDDASFLERAIQRFSPTALIRDPAYPSIRLGEIEKMKVLAPRASIDRRRIAEFLDKVDALRSKRRAILAELETLAQSIFLDMFGDPSTNPKGWQVGTIRDVLDSASYGTSERAEASGEFPVLRMNNITRTGEMVFTELKYMDLKEDQRERYLVRAGDVLFNRTNSADLVGKTAIYREANPMAYAGYLIRLRVKSKNEPEYLAAFLNTMYSKRVLRSICKNIIGMANINARELQSLRIPVPAHPAQRDFSDCITALEKLKASHRVSLAEHDELFATLQQRAFRGDL